MGGTFDPIHHGHLIMASYAADTLALDQILFVPAQLPPHKIGEDITAACHRVAMVKAAIGPDPRFSFSDMDLRNEAPSYTSDLLARFHATQPDADLHFIVGADSLRDFPTWHEPNRILDLARLAVARRPGVVIDESTLDAIPRLRDRTTIFASPLIGISSTRIRERVAARKAITWLLPSSVERYILENGLYLKG
jgi:nicotinate-nucleotide adenylyltransferase